MNSNAFTNSNPGNERYYGTNLAGELWFHDASWLWVSNIQSFIWWSVLLGQFTYQRVGVQAATNNVWTSTGFTVPAGKTFVLDNASATGITTGTSDVTALRVRDAVAQIETSFGDPSWNDILLDWGRMWEGFVFTEWEEIEIFIGASTAIPYDAFLSGKLYDNANSVEFFKIEADNLANQTVSSVLHTVSAWKVFVLKSATILNEWDSSIRVVSSSFNAAVYEAFNRNWQYSWDDLIRESWDTLQLRQSSGAARSTVICGYEKDINVSLWYGIFKWVSAAMNWTTLVVTDPNVLPTSVITWTAQSNANWFIEIIPGTGSFTINSSVAESGLIFNYVITN